MALASGWGSRKQVRVLQAPGVAKGVTRGLYGHDQGMGDSLVQLRLDYWLINDPGVPD